MPYTWLWFDADDTLYDYKRGETAALEKTFQQVGLAYRPEYLPAYSRYNQALWRELEQKRVTPQVLRVLRFERLLSEFNLDYPAAEFSETYLKALADSSVLLPGAEAVVRALQPRYRIAVLTNGLKDVQRPRLMRSAIWDCITTVVVSEEVGAAKPAPEFFEIASAQTGYPPKSEILMIGDNLGSDIRGASAYGLDTCWFNPAGLPRPEDLAMTYEIRKLEELLSFL